ncbi:MAG: 6-phosphogluconolactonase [Omnitrophica bacterium]|nr:6-phosphogluconolactonase [Candidatus Omnitrophota bacterium]
MRTAKKGSILIFDDHYTLDEFACEKWKEIGEGAMRERGVFTAAVSGGTSPVGFYRRLAASGKEINRQSTHIFFADERFVSKKNRESNYRMVKENLLDRAGFPSRNVHAVSIEKTSALSAVKYERSVKIFFKIKKGGFPKFDLIMLGLGADGHTASLFPGNKTLQERKRLVVSVSDSAVKTERITLTLPVLLNARNIIFIVKGGEKAGVVKEVLRSKRSFLPAAMVKRSRGNIYFLLGRAVFSVPKKKKISIDK